jgi:hypothetical protein
MPGVVGSSETIELIPRGGHGTPRIPRSLTAHWNPERAIEGRRRAVARPPGPTYECARNGRGMETLPAPPCSAFGGETFDDQGPAPPGHVPAQTPIRLLPGKRKRPARRRGAFADLKGRRPTLPPGLPGSTIGAGGLNFSVRNGKRCFPSAIATGMSVAAGARGAAPQDQDNRNERRAKLAI